MKVILVALAMTISLSAVAEGDLSISKFAQSTRNRIVKHITEALDGEGRDVSISGVITFIGEDYFFLQQNDFGMKVWNDGFIDELKTGESVRVYGKPSLEGGRVVFVAKKYESNGIVPMPDAPLVEAEELTDARTSGQTINWRLITIEGRAIALTENGFAMNYNGIPITVIAKESSRFLSDCGDTHPQVKVTGVVELVLDQATLVGRRSYVMGIKLNVASEGDIKLVEDYAYLSAKHRKIILTLWVGVSAILGCGLISLTIVIFRQRHRLFISRTIMAERKRMADDLHDTIEQHLVGAGMLLRLNNLKVAQDVLVQARKEMRDIIWGLKNDDMMRLKPLEMVNKLACDENAKGLCIVDVKGHGLPAEMNASEMRDLSLIIREAIGNAIKHGDARRVEIRIKPNTNGGWKVQIANDGSKFEPENSPGASTGHFGIEGMHQRARRLKATLSFYAHGDWMVVELEKGEK